MEANMWENSLKNAESDNNKILYETLLDFFLQRNGTYFLNKPRISKVIKSSLLDEFQAQFFWCEWRAKCWPVHIKLSYTIKYLCL